MNWNCEYFLRLHCQIQGSLFITDIVKNKNLKKIRCFLLSEVTLNYKRSKWATGKSGGGKPTPVEFCWPESSQRCLKGSWQWKLVVIINGKYDNIFYETWLFCLSYFFDDRIRLYFIWRQMVWWWCTLSLGCAPPPEELDFFEWVGGKGSKLKIITHSRDIAWSHYEVSLKLYSIEN